MFNRRRRAKVQFAVGNVSATSADGQTRSLKKGDRIYTGDTVKTGEQGSAQLIYRDRSRMAVRVNTTFKIDEFSYDEKNKKGASSIFRPKNRVSFWMSASAPRGLGAALM